MAKHEFVKQSDLSACKCVNPSISVMDHTQFSLNNKRSACVPMVNRCCTKCWKHWSGPVGNVVAYSRKQWDARMAQALVAV